MSLMVAIENCDQRCGDLWNCPVDFVALGVRASKCDGHAPGWTDEKFNLGGRSSQINVGIRGRKEGDGGVASVFQQEDDVYRTLVILCNQRIDDPDR
jgi:hypothetical protein